MKFGPDSTRFVDEPRKEPSASDGLTAALADIRAEDLHKVAVDLTSGVTPENVHPETPVSTPEASKLVEPAASPAPALLVTGVGELDHTSANVESDRQRAYAIIAEIDAEHKTIPDKRAGAIDTFNRAKSAMVNAEHMLSNLLTREEELTRTRAEAADRAISLGQILLDTEAARLRRGL